MRRFRLIAQTEANPDIVVRGTAAASSQVLSRFHEAFGQVPTRTALTGFVATQQQFQHMEQALQGHGFDQHARSMRTPANITVTPMQYSGAPTAGRPYSGAPLALPASTWGAVGPVVLNLQHRQPQGAAPSPDGAAALVGGAGQAAAASAAAAAAAGEGQDETRQERRRRLDRSRCAINRDNEAPQEAALRKQREAERSKRRRREAKEAEAERSAASASRGGS
jgi:hypothetical protein